MRLNRNYWTKDKCETESRKYNNPNSLKKNNNYVYVKCYKNFWLEEFYPNFNIKREKYWTKDRCQSEALKYKTRKDFSKMSRTAYTISLRNKWIDDVCQHMDKKPASYWTLEKCQSEALKYKTRTDFKNQSYQAYKYSILNCFIDDICDHMPIVGNMYKRCVYSFEFEDNHVYIGLTYNIDKRIDSHYKNLNSQVNKHINRTGLCPKIIKITDYIDVEDARIKESEYIYLYKNKNWVVLNIQKAGNVGGVKKINEEYCKNIINNYKYLIDFRKEQPNVYKSIIRYNWNHLIESLSRDMKEHGYWTKDKCQEVALKYSRRIDFFKNDISAYNKSQKFGWLDDICNHMEKRNIKPKGFWTIDNVIQESTKYKTKEEFKKGSPSAYSYYIKNKLYDVIILEGRKKWTKEECLELIKKCSNKKDIRNISEQLYRIYIKNRWDIQSYILFI